MSACGIVGGIVVSRQPATRGTDSANDLAVNPRTCRNRNSDRSSATFPFADPSHTRSHSPSRNRGHDRAVEVPPRPARRPRVTRAPRNRLASVSYRSTVIGANPRSATSHSPVLLDQLLTGDSTGGSSPTITPTSRR